MHQLSLDLPSALLGLNPHMATRILYTLASLRISFRQAVSSRALLSVCAFLISPWTAELHWQDSAALHSHVQIQWFTRCFIDMRSGATLMEPPCWNFLYWAWSYGEKIIRKVSRPDVLQLDQCWCCDKLICLGQTLWGKRRCSRQHWERIKLRCSAVCIKARRCRKCSSKLKIAALQVVGQIGTLIFIANFILYISTSLPRTGRTARSNKSLSYIVSLQNQSLLTMPKGSGSCMHITFLYFLSEEDHVEPVMEITGKISVGWIFQNLQTIVPNFYLSEIISWFNGGSGIPTVDKNSISPHHIMSSQHAVVSLGKQASLWIPIACGTMGHAAGPECFCLP